MSKTYLKITESANSFFQNTILSTIFLFKSNVYQIGSLFEKILAPILFPLAIVPDAIASLFLLYRFSQAKNKNLGKVFDLIHASIKTALVFTAVFAGLSLVFVQGLFLTAIGSSVIYHLGLSILHAYHWLKSKKDAPVKALHKNHAINNLIATTIGGIVITGIILTMVVAPYLAAYVLTIAGITTASLLMLATIYTIYRNFKNPSLSPIINLLNEDRPEANKSSLCDHSASPTSSLITEMHPLPIQKNQNSNYYSREFRSEKLTGNQEQDKNFLIREIQNKEKSLNEQITKAKNSVSEYFWPQEAKRSTKINELKIFNVALNNNDKAMFKPLSTRGSQSFFKQFGDCEDISYAIKRYFQLYSPR